MSGLAILIPVALLLGGSGLAAFFWALRSGQFEDLEGAALRIFDHEGTPGLTLGSLPPMLGNAETALVRYARQRRTTERLEAAAASPRRAAEPARLRF